MKVLVADCETDGLIGALTRIHCLAVGDPRTDEVTLYADDDPDCPSVAEGVARLSQADRVVFHNGAGFDWPVINRFYPGAIAFETLWDTLVVTRLLDPALKDNSLEKWGDRLGFPKFDYKAWCKSQEIANPWSRYTPKMGEYCCQDVRVTKKIYRICQTRLRKYSEQGCRYPDAIRIETGVAFIIGLQERHGFRINLKKCVALEAELRQEQRDILTELQTAFPTVLRPEKATWDTGKRAWTGVAVTQPKRTHKVWTCDEGGADQRRIKTKGEDAVLETGWYTHYSTDGPYCKIAEEAFNPASGLHITHRLSREYGWRPTKYTPTGSPATDEEVLKDLPYEKAQLIVRYQRVVKQLGQLADGKNAWLKLARDEGNGYGRIHGRVNPLGARTNRMTHFAPNVAQVDKKDLRMREAWEPNEGDIQVGVDAEGLELRCLGHDLARWDGGAYSRAVVEGRKEDGTDAHSLAQRACGTYSRNNQKTVTYAFLYGAGNPKLGQEIVNDAYEAGKPKPGGSLAQIGKRARENLELGIEGLGSLVSACQKATRERGWLKGLDGRHILSNSEHSALNTRLQSSGAIVMKWALYLFHFELCVARGHVDPVTLEPTAFNYLANVHDESQKSVRPEKAEAIGALFAEAIALSGERLDVRCPLAGSYAAGSSWRDTH